MEHTRYTISQAADLLGVRDSVLRYWEDELDLRVRRNGQGHRYYTGADIELLCKVKELKKQGLQLRAIRQAISETKTTISVEEQRKRVDPDKKHQEFQMILQRLIMRELGRESEGHYRFLDEKIRKCQIARKEAAAALETGTHKKERE